MLRKADLRDLDTLVEIENTCFDVDRFSRRTFRYLLTKANAETLVYEEGGRCCRRRAVAVPGAP